MATEGGIASFLWTGAPDRLPMFQWMVLHLYMLIALNAPGRLKKKTVHETRGKNSGGEGGGGVGLIITYSCMKFSNDIFEKKSNPEELTFPDNVPGVKGFLSFPQLRRFQWSQGSP